MSRGEAEADGADEEEVAGQELEVGFDGGGDVGVVVFPERGLPEKRGAEEAGEDEDEHEGRGKEAGGGTGDEFAEKFAKAFTISQEFHEGKKAEGNEEPFDREFGGPFDQGVGLAEGGGEGNGPQDLVKGPNPAGGAGSPKPKGGGGEEEDKLEALHDPFLGGEGWIVREPGREKDGKGAGKNESRGNERLFGRLGGWAAH